MVSSSLLVILQLCVQTPEVSLWHWIHSGFILVKREREVWNLVFICEVNNEELSLFLRKTLVSVFEALLTLFMAVNVVYLQCQTLSLAQFYPRYV